MPEDTDELYPVPNEGHVDLHGPHEYAGHPSGQHYEPVQVNQQFAAPNRVNDALGLGYRGWVVQFGAVGFLMIAFGFGGHYLLTTAKELQTTVLQDFRDARKEDSLERSADRERTLKLAESLVRLEESHNRQNAVIAQQADSMARLATAMERLKLATKPATPVKKDPDHADTPEPAPMPRGCP